MSTAFLQGVGWSVRRVLVMVFALAMSLVVAVGPAAGAELNSEAVIARTKSAILYAQIDPQGHDTTCSAQYVTEAQFKQSGWNGVASVPCSPEDLGAGSSPVAATVAFPSLEISTMYHYRFLLTSESTTIAGSEETFMTFGVEQFSFEALDPKSFGSTGEPLELEPFMRAGAHPFELTTHIVANTTQYKGEISPDAIMKDVLTKLPAGLVGNPTAMPRCQVRVVEEKKCGAASEVGTITVFQSGREFGPQPLFDVIPPNGDAARFAGEINVSTDGYIDAGVRTGEDYGVTAGGYDITALAPVTAVSVTLWGVPNASSHDAERWCPKAGGGAYQHGCAAEGPEKPFLTLGSDCRQLQPVTAELTSYAEPDEKPVTKTATMPSLASCSTEPFAPSIEAKPTTATADTHTGLRIDLHVPQNEDPSGQATADLKDATVVFPEGLVVDPSSADGLEACSEAQAGFTGFTELDPSGEPGIKTSQFTPGPAECPDASKLAMVEVKTPLLDHPLTGGLYLAQQDENPFGSLIAVYLTVYDPISGVVIKLPGKVEANPVTGRLASTFEQNPQLPFEDLEVDLPDGSRAALTTPFVCGSYATTTELVPWSSPEGTTVSPSSSPFTIDEAPGGGACVGSEAQAANAPGFEAGTASPVAGTYSPFVLKLVREDGSQHFDGLDVTLPPGLVGRIAGLQQCPQAAIEAALARSHEGEGAVERQSPSCPAGSEVGVVRVGAGAGAPLYVTGHAYFAGPYEGAPFSLVFVTPAVAGPFDLGTVVVRAALYIDQSTAQVTVKSDPFPTILDGIPLDVRSVTIETTRGDFTLNPTNCNTMSVTGQERSAAGQTASLSDRYQAGGCTTLPFHPSFAASSSGRTSRANGASLTVKVGSSAGQANIAKVHVELPKQLPSRQSTLKLACREVVFATNPATCPEGSRVGIATADTPLLNVALTGPAYLVSHGGAAFPDLDIVLQGEGITLVLDGKTNINEHTSITSSTFETVPDAPISSFELSLPQGPYSVLGAPTGLCGLTRTAIVKRKVTVRAKNGQRKTIVRKIKKTIPITLSMPTVLTGQNGAAIKQNTPIAVNDCPKAGKPLAAKRKTKSKKKGKGKK